MSETRCFVWRCRLCGGIERGPHGMKSPSVMLGHVIEVMNHGCVRNPGIDGHLAGLGRTGVHFCDITIDGRIGVTDLIGVEPEKGPTP